MPIPQRASAIIPTLRYRDVQAAVRWLTYIFDFHLKSMWEGPEENKIDHAELTLAGGIVILRAAPASPPSRVSSFFGLRKPAPVGNGRASRYVVVLDTEIDEIYRRVEYAVRRGAEIAAKRIPAAPMEVPTGGTLIQPLATTAIGHREFTVADLEGYTWTVSTDNPWP